VQVAYTPGRHSNEFEAT